MGDDVSILCLIVKVHEHLEDGYKTLLIDRRRKWNINMFSSLFLVEAAFNLQGMCQSMN
jgi:hypothetical protein